MVSRSRLMMIGAGFTAILGGTVFAVTTTAATRPAPAAAPTVSAVTQKDKAAASALAKVPGTIHRSETECEDGRLVYSFEIATSDGVVKVSVDALTNVASTKVDDDEEESSGRVEKGKKGHAEHADDDEDDDDNGSCSADAVRGSR